jgi:hypothetical protein
VACKLAGNRQSPAASSGATASLPASTGFSPNQHWADDSLAFEVTESVVMHDLEHTAQLLTEIRELVPAFRSTTSAPATPVSLPAPPAIDILKIDRIFVRDLHLEPDAAAIAHADIAMATNSAWRRRGRCRMRCATGPAAGIRLRRRPGLSVQPPVPPEQYAIIRNKTSATGLPTSRRPPPPSKWNTPAPRRTERSLGIGNAAP